MKYKLYILYIVNVILLIICIITGCNSTTYDNQSIPNIHIEETITLIDDTCSPYCDFSIDYNYLNEKDDSIAELINRTIQHELLGYQYTSLSPETALDSFKNEYARNYREETGKLYQTDKAKASSVYEFPNWYNRTYSLVTFIEEGYKGIINVSANFFVDMGGAHPNQWGKWMNFDSNSGKLLTKEDVFPSSVQKDIEQILVNHLMQMQAELYPDEDLNTLEDLQQKGFLQSTNMYIPDNFLLSKEAVLFLFNRYDIAPYSAGEIVIKVPYEEIKVYLNEQFLWN